MKTPFFLLLAALLAGCTLPDQRLFNPDAGRKPVQSVPAPITHPEPALITIRYTTPEPAYGATLTRLVQKALSLKPDALFTVTTRIRPRGDVLEQQAEAQSATLSGREVAQSIQDAGAAPGQILQTLRTDPTLQEKQVTVTVH